VNSIDFRVREIDISISVKITGVHDISSDVLCDTNEDGNLDACEVHSCVVIVENEYRTTYCRDYEMIICDCPWVNLDVCNKDRWECSDVAEYTVAIL
jgi:hypothetical protein